MIATTRDQSARLLRCGVSADTADMIYQMPITVSQKAAKENILLVKNADKTLFDTDTPAWSLSGLLPLLPSVIKIHTPQGLEIYTIQLYFYENGERWYNLAYVFIHRSLLSITTNNLIEAVVQMIEQLTANGYKLNDCPCREKGGENE